MRFIDYLSFFIPVNLITLNSSCHSHRIVEAQFSDLILNRQPKAQDFYIPYKLIKIAANWKSDFQIAGFYEIHTKDFRRENNLGMAMITRRKGGITRVYHVSDCSWSIGRTNRPWAHREGGRRESWELEGKFLIYKVTKAMKPGGIIAFVNGS